MAGSMMVKWGGAFRTIYGSWAVRATGVTDVQELLSEEISNLRWWLYGPTDIYDPDDWRAMEEWEQQELLDEWEKEMARATGDEHLRLFNQRRNKLNGIMIAYDICSDVLSSYYPRYLNSELP